MAITKQTPNETADLGLVRVVPQWAQSDPRTTELVGKIRAQAPGWETKLKISDITVTGQTAVAIDVNSRLSGALVPFGLVVVGLALILLMIVFRSIAVPIKAALGYLLSIAAALGTVTAAFIWGWGAGPLGITEIGPLVSFLPIILMGVLFGLAMDYEVFLVSAIREDYVHSGHASPQERARHAIRTGFISSARVVTAAAVIMISVFAAFIPHGSSTIKPIALGLAVGVFVDAFLVRMTLVPAVLALLGEQGVVDAEAAGPGAAAHRRRGLRAGPSRRAGRVGRDQRCRRRPGRGRRHRHRRRSGARSTCRCRGGRRSATTIPIRPSGRRWSGRWAGGASRSAGTWRCWAGCCRKRPGPSARSVRVVPLPSRDDDAVDVRRYVSTLLVAQSDKPWPSRRTTNQALDQAESWLSPLRAEADEQRLADRRLGDLAPLERRLVTLSAAAVQSPELIVVAEPDRDLDPGAMSWFAGVCAELVHDTGTTVLLVGSTVTALADRAASPVPPEATSTRVADVAPICRWSDVPRTRATTDATVTSELVQTGGRPGDGSPDDAASGRTRLRGRVSPTDRADPTTCRRTTYPADPTTTPNPGSRPMSSPDSRPKAHEPVPRWLVPMVAVILTAIAGGSRAVGGAGSPEQRPAVPLAIVNLDAPVTQGTGSDAKTIAAGRQLAGSLSSPDSDDETPLSWQLVDQDDAATGLRDGTYYGVLTIPKDFSAGITSTSGSDPKQAELKLVSDDAASAAVAALAQLSVNQAARTMGDQVTNNYVDAMLQNLTTINKNLTSSAKSADSLASSAHDLASSSHSLADSADQVADGASSLDSGTKSLLSGTKTLASGAQDAATGAAQVASGSRELATAADKLASGAGKTSDGADDDRRKGPPTWPGWPTGRRRARVTWPR